MAKYINTDALEVVGFTDQEGSFSDGVQWLLEYIDTLPSEDVIPVSWIKEKITWLMGTGNGPAALTAVNLSSLLNVWRDEAKDFE